MIRCGELHFARIPREYWKQRLQMCKAMGLNAVCLYLFWNFHEWEEGKYDWSGERDALEFCRLAQQEGLWVILRPGPYSCAEWEMGGLPWWLLKGDRNVLRTRDPEFMKPALAWIKEVGRVFAPEQITQGGPILMVQVENEYGYYGDDVKYLDALKSAFTAAGFDIPMFVCNPPNLLSKPVPEGLLKVANFGSDAPGAFKTLRQIQPDAPLMCGEFYPGWFDGWGTPHQEGNLKGYLKNLEYMLENNISFSIYMAHGGTSFGLWAGSVGPKPQKAAFSPDTTSYDYDAPISEAGWVTPKFLATRELIKKHSPAEQLILEPPQAAPVVAFPQITLREQAPLFENLPQPITDTEPRTMEKYAQGRGVILYRTTLPPGPAGTLEAAFAHDLAWVFLDGKPMGVMDRRSRKFSIDLPERSKAATLDILVEAMGRINFSPQLHDRKGLQGPVVVKSGDQVTPLHDWRVFRLGLDDKMLADLQWKPTTQNEGAAFWKGAFTVDKPGDTFLDVSSWGKGVVWINGHCLGRFWNIGPQQTLYLPGPWLKKGTNEIVILDLLGPAQPVVQGVERPVLNKLRPEADFSPADYSKIPPTPVPPLSIQQQ
ncbi:glycoside hydrolase family 35 protein [Terrimicrobium sacchariphilum]|uniref:glycoside hydrolase family 35 protein n=1 Tax=Terrimicrobium sacchariphilum TaxID=690879 RepID=UPI001EDC7D06|nr:beta-galactosidase family protein [Terrimicrobium sacchariphilum]